MTNINNINDERYFQLITEGELKNSSFFHRRISDKGIPVFVMQIPPFIAWAGTEEECIQKISKLIYNGIYSASNYRVDLSIFNNDAKTKLPQLGERNYTIPPPPEPPADPPGDHL